MSGMCVCGVFLLPCLLEEIRGVRWLFPFDRCPLFAGVLAVDCCKYPLPKTSAQPKLRALGTAASIKLAQAQPEDVCECVCVCVWRVT